MLHYPPDRRRTAKTPAGPGFLETNQAHLNPQFALAAGADCPAL